MNRKAKEERICCPTAWLGHSLELQPGVKTSALLVPGPADSAKTALSALQGPQLVEGTASSGRLPGLQNRVSQFLMINESPSLCYLYIPLAVSLQNPD